MLRPNIFMFCAKEVGIQRQNVRARPALMFALLAALTLSVSGCSYVVVNGPPPEHANMVYFSCTESNAFPIIDGVAAVLSGIHTFLVVGDRDAYDDKYGLGASSQTLMGLGTVATLGYGFAALEGSNRTDNCRDAKRDWAERRMQGSGGLE